MIKTAPLESPATSPPSTPLADLSWKSSHTCAQESGIFTAVIPQPWKTCIYICTKKSTGKQIMAYLKNRKLLSNKMNTIDTHTINRGIFLKTNVKGAKFQGTEYDVNANLKT